MADCSNGLDHGRDLPCEAYQGGLSDVFLISYDRDIQFVSTDQLVNSISGLTTATAFRFALDATTNTANASTVYDKDSGTVLSTHTAVLNLPGLSIDDSNQVRYMMGKRAFVIIKDNNDNYVLYGRKRGARLTQADENIGGAYTDFSGYILTMVAEEKYGPAILSPAAVTTLLANTASND